MTTTAKPIGAQWRGIFLDGPQPDVDDEGEEIPVWVVYVGNDDGEPIGNVYRLHHDKSAELLAYRMAATASLQGMKCGSCRMSSMTTARCSRKAVPVGP